jgi:3-dehydroquinate synthase
MKPDIRLPEHIRLSENPGADLQHFLDVHAYGQVAVLTDENTLTHCYPLISDYISGHTLITIPAGEPNKNLNTCTGVWRQMTIANLDRKSVLVIVGGGMAGDLGGFCAATFKRGIDFVLLPTTLLAQADASIGGKVGIDFDDYKNQLGAFQHPVFTLLAPLFLKTLPEDELRSGFAEIIKHALISDGQWWNEISKLHWTHLSWPEQVKRSASFKWSVVQQDPKEGGLRKILNAGHTLGHAIESWFLRQNRPILHGEAVAAGLICECYIARKLDLLNEAEHQEITGYILSVFGKLHWDDAQTEHITLLCYQDKKNKGHKVMMSLLNGVGQAGWDYEIPMDTAIEALRYYQAIQM